MATSARLAEITVDVKTVEMPKKAEASAVTVPKPAADLKPGTANYKASIEVGGQTIPFTMTRERSSCSVPSHRPSKDWWNVTVDQDIDERFLCSPGERRWRPLIVSMTSEGGTATR